MAVESIHCFFAQCAGGRTQGNVCDDFSDWHRGRAPYVFWVLDVDSAPLRQRVAAAAHHLKDLLLDGYRRQAHVTLDLCGFPAAHPEGPDEFSPALIDRQCAALDAAALSPFAIEIGGVESFASAPYLGVYDPDGCIGAVRDALAVDGHHRLLGAYVPHVTIGLYADFWPAGPVAARLASLSLEVPLVCRVTQLSLMAYQPHEIGGPLTRLAAFDLQQQAMVWRQALLFPTEAP